MWAMWLIVVVILTFLELITINLVSIWFILSGIVSLFLSFFINSFYVQFFVFVILGIILMILTRPYLMKKVSTTRITTNLDRVIGMEGIVTEEIKKHRIGEVKVDGKKWSAISKEEIQVGEIVNVKDIDGVKLIVRKGDN